MRIALTGAMLWGIVLRKKVNDAYRSKLVRKSIRRRLFLKGFGTPLKQTACFKPVSKLCFKPLFQTIVEAVFFRPRLKPPFQT